MPQAPKKLCFRCGKLYRGAACDNCGPSKRSPKRVTEATRLRATSKWRRLSELRRKDFPFCENPFNLANHSLVEAIDAHHRKPIEERPDLALDYDNLMSVCRRCHARLERTAHE